MEDDHSFIPGCSVSLQSLASELTGRGTTPRTNPWTAISTWLDLVKRPQHCEMQPYADMAIVSSVFSAATTSLLVVGTDKNTSRMLAHDHGRVFTCQQQSCQTRQGAGRNLPRRGCIPQLWTRMIPCLSSHEGVAGACLVTRRWNACATPPVRTPCKLYEAVTTRKKRSRNKEHYHVVHLTPRHVVHFMRHKSKR